VGKLSADEVFLFRMLLGTCDFMNKELLVTIM